jgi:SAM-dependent methyltransferase
MNGMLTGTDGVRQTWIARTRSHLLRTLFRTLYGSGASIYERFTQVVFVGEWRRWQSTAVDGLSTASVVVELGCGPGEFAAEMSDRCKQWIGLDISQEMIHCARRHHRPPALLFLRADAGATPLKSGVADTVLATFPSNYIYDHNVLGEIKRILKPGGRFVVVLTGELYGDGFRRRCTRAITRVLQGRQGAAIDVARLPEFSGMTGHYEWRPTAFGRALVFTGKPSPTSDDGCSPPPGDAAGRETGRPPG